MLCVHGSPSCYSSLHQCHPRHPAPLLGLQEPSASGCLHACATSSTDQGAYGLVGGEELIDAERDQLLELCRQRLDAFRMQRGEEVGCLLTQKPAASPAGDATAPRSAARIKVRVLTRAKGRCECCGASCCLAHPDPVTPGHSLVIPRLHGSDGLVLHQPEWNAVVEPIAKRMHMSHVGKRFIGAEFNDIQCLTTNAFRLNSMRTWVSNSRFSSDRTRSSRVVRSWLPM